MKNVYEMTNAERRDYYDSKENLAQYIYGSRGGWVKYKGNPVLGGDYGTCFDMSVIKDNGLFKMWFSWRPQKSIAYSESTDGYHWSPPVNVLTNNPGSSWEADEVNRPCVIKMCETYKMWYSGQMRPYQEDGISVLGYAESNDGVNWSRIYDHPVLVPSDPWEKNAIMCPHVFFDEEEQVYKLWYSAGSNHEPDSIGYAVSKDGIVWDKDHRNPILSKDVGHIWEKHKVLGACVIKHEGYYYMFYIGHLHEERANICLARSRDGITYWEKFRDNPIIAPDKGAWDSMSVYKPYAMRDGNRWILWYNGAEYNDVEWVFEQIGIAVLEKDSFGF